MKNAASVLVVSYNTRELTVRAVASVIADPLVERVIVVDNASQDGSAEAVREAFPDVLVLSQEQNLGFAKGVNVGLRHVETAFVLLLNSDAVCDTSIAGLCMFLDQRPGVAAASPTVVDEDGNIQHVAQPEPSAWRVLLESTRAHKLLPPRTRGRVLLGPYWHYDEPVEVGWTWGTAVLLRMDAARQLGGLDERFFLYGEDVEWCVRARRAGWKISVTSEAMVRHLGAGSSPAHATVTERRIESVFRGLVPHVSRGRLVRLDLALRVGATIDRLVPRSRRGGYAAAHEALARVLDG